MVNPVIIFFHICNPVIIFFITHTFVIYLEKILALSLVNLVCIIGKRWLRILEMGKERYDSLNSNLGTETFSIFSFPHLFGK